MGYFHRTKDITLSKLEVLADFFGMPLDYFRQGNGFKAKNLQSNADGEYFVKHGADDGKQVAEHASRKHENNHCGKG